jgi:hypothetical protein
MTINEYLATHKNADGIVPKITCKNGLVLSVQAHARAYCKPKNDVGPYSEVEVGELSEDVPSLWVYEELTPNLGSTHPYVPVDVVEAVIAAHGGIKS